MGFSTAPVALWGGVECSLNRVGEDYHDQLLRNGHHFRREDLDDIARLDIRTLRYPVLWERTAPDDPAHPDWTWSDERLAYLQALQISPIVGLLHHGSGPRYATFEQPHFASAFADYARQVAERYPWVKAYTPVNEPLTNARFAGLYGHWYPHGQDDLTFCRILLNQCKATVLAMQAIREIQPEAQLIQTEDLGQTFSRPKLQYQADFENHRRWLTFDLLCGRMNETHPLWRFFIKAGIEPHELYFFLRNPCPPDIIGGNYYLTSERFLDEAVENYPQWLHGSNGRHIYADVEAVRVPEVQLAGVENLITQVWERYKIPVAITEVHLGCTREEQLRWLYQSWQSAQVLKNQGVDIRAVTVWALTGSFDWNTLLTQLTGYYEPGAFDLRSSPPRPTALATLIRQLQTPDAELHTVVREAGWWQKKEVPSLILDNFFSAKCGLLIIGPGTGLGKICVQCCEQRGLTYRTAELPDINPQQLLLLKPWAIVLATHWQPHIASLNALTGLPELTQFCRDAALPLLLFSSDQVFDGTKGSPYTEADRVSPLSRAGWQEAEAEKLAASLPSALVVRTGERFGMENPQGSVHFYLQNLLTESFSPAPDHIRFSPTYLPDVVHHSLDLLLDEAHGIWHLANEGEASWAELVRMMALGVGLSRKKVEYWYEQQREASSALAPSSTILTSRKARLMPSLENALERFFNEQ
jgi:dTDP-4-dehydrorhamnose reductase